MADNVTITSGANSTPPDGTQIATDDVAGVQFQRVKLDVGADGASTPVVGSLPVSGTVGVSGTVAVSAVSLPLPTGAATDTLQNAEAVLIGAVTEGAPGTDTASSGLNGRLQRIAQRLTSLIALLPASLGQKTSAASLAVVVASDQSAIPASQSGTWTVQPGNTANTTAWKVDASSVAVPVTDNSGSLTVDAPVGTPVFVRLSDGAAAITALPVTDNAGSLTVDNAGTFAVQTSSAATDASTTEPAAELIAGWDGLNVRSAFMQNLDGHNTLFTHDNLNRRLLEAMLIEQRILNAQIARLLGPQGLTQRDLEPGPSLMN